MSMSTTGKGGGGGEKKGHLYVVKRAGAQKSPGSLTIYTTLFSNQCMPLFFHCPLLVHMVCVCVWKKYVSRLILSS